jgi:hypothetical protein
VCVKRLLNDYLLKIDRQKKPPDALPQREVKNQAEHYEEELLGGITPGGS